MSSPREFGVEASAATTLFRLAGGQFVTHVEASPGNPYDGRTLAEMEKQIGATGARVRIRGVLRRRITGRIFAAISPS